MTVKPVVLHVTDEETLRLTRILKDEDKEATQTFLRECLKPQLDQTTRGCMVRAFETL